MYKFDFKLKGIVAAFLLVGAVSPQAWAQAADLDTLFEQLRDAEPAAAAQIERRIWAEWSRSGSPAMDLLLERGREALEAEDTVAAVEHFTALVDHAPGFAEGYNARAMAYFRMQRYGPALADIRRTLALNPRHFGAMSGLALILQDIGMEAEALEAWRAVTDLHPHSDGAAEAIDRLERAVEGSSL